MIENPEEMGERPELPDDFKTEPYGYDRPCKRCGTMSPHFLCRDCYAEVAE